MATKKKPTAKQLAARKKFAQAAKNGTLAKKRKATASGPKRKAVKAVKARTARTGPTIEKEFKALARDLGYTVTKRKPRKAAKKTTPKRKTVKTKTARKTPAKRKR